MLVKSIWLCRLVTTLLYVNAVCGQKYQHHTEEFIFEQQPLQQYGGYETHRQYRSSGNEPTTIAPSSETIKDILFMNQTLGSDLDNNSTHTSTRDINDMFPSDLEFIDDADVMTLSDGSINLVTDMPVENTSMASSVPSLMVDRDTSKSLLETSILGSIEQLNTTVEGMNSTMDNSTDEGIKILRRRQAPQGIQQIPVLPQQVPSLFQPLPNLQPQQVPLSLFQPLPNQRVNQFVQVQQLSQQPAQQPAFFARQPGQPVIVQLPIEQPRFVSDQMRFVQPQILVPQQIPLQKNQASVTQPPAQSLNGLPKLSLNPVPLPTPISPLHPIMTISASANVSQANAVKAREANANKVMPKVQPLMGAFKPMVSSAPTRPTLPVPSHVAPAAPTTMSPSLQRPGIMQLPAQSMVRPQLQGQQVPPQSQPGVVEQSTTPLPRELIVRPSPSFATQEGQPPMVLKSPPSPVMQSLPTQIGQRSGSPMNQQPQPMGQVPAPLSQMEHRPEPPMDQSQQSKNVMQPMNQPPPAAQRSGLSTNLPFQPQPIIQSMGPPPSDAQRSVPPMNQPSQPQPMNQASLLQTQRSGSPMDLPQQPMPVGQSMNQASLDAQRSASPLNQPSQTQNIGQAINQAVASTQVVQRPGQPSMVPLQSPPMGQAPLAQVAQRSGPPIDQPLQPIPEGQSMNQAPPGAQRSGMNQPPMNQPPMNQPPMNQPPMNQPPMNQPPMNQPPMNQSPMNQPPMNQPPMNQPPMNQPPMGQPTGQVSPAQGGQRSGLPPVNQPLPPPSSSQQQDQSFGSQSTLPQQFSPRMSSPMSQPVPLPMMGFPSQTMDGVPLPLSQLNQRSVHDDRGNSGNKERHLMRRSADGHHMVRRQMDAVLYPSKEAYDSYVVNNYHNLYDEVYPTYSLPVYTTTTTSLPVYIATTAAAPKFEYYAPRY